MKSCEFGEIIKFIERTVNDMDELEEIKSGKEIEDIIFEKKRIQQLMNSSKWNQLDAYLKGLNKKYSAETFIYNCVNPIMPQSIPENAQNCIKFLESLLHAKTLDVASRSKDSYR